MSFHIYENRDDLRAGGHVVGHPLLDRHADLLHDLGTVDLRLLDLVHDVLQLVHHDLLVHLLHLDGLALRLEDGRRLLL
jgi:hypothetical protein